MKHPSEYWNEEVLVMGLAKSGVAAATLFHQLGAQVIVNDYKQRDECPEAEQLEKLGICVICGSHPEELVHKNVALIVKNPGIPYHITPIARALELGIEIVSEVEVAYHMSLAPMIGITGSNGKTTTTTLIGLMLAAAGKSPIVAGNIGRALTEAVSEARSDQWLVVELSSFQLKGTSQFRPRISLLLNLYETHLDYHQSIEDYMASKARIFQNQTIADIAILNADDSFCQSMIPQVKAQIALFSMKEELPIGVYLESQTQMIVYRNSTGERIPILSATDIGIPGAYNIENAMAAISVALHVGVAPEIMSQVLQDFRGVEHRLEYVRELDGVTFYNNSKATNPAATIKSIEAFIQPLILIAGGLDRGSDYMELLPIFESRIKGIVTIGQTSTKLRKVAERAGIQHIITIDGVGNSQDVIARAVRAAQSLSVQGDIVLLSPACASWDMFTSYEHRGSMFKDCVHNL